MALDVCHRLLGEAAQLALLEDRQAARLLGPEPDLEAAALTYPVEERLERGGEALGVGPAGAQGGERVAKLPDHPAHGVAQVGQGIAGTRPAPGFHYHAGALQGGVDGNGGVWVK